MIYLVPLLYLLLGVVSTTESYRETLLLRPLPDGRLQTSFNFRLDSTSSSPSHFRLLPRPLVQIVQAYNVSEVHLSLNTGRWQYKNWGTPQDDMVGPGAELWAKTSPENWRALTSSFAGLFCASLDALDEKSTVKPTQAFGGDALHAFLPSENVCTENLTSLLKLLPCKGHAGLASLLNPVALFGANFQGMGVHVTKRDKGGWKVRLTVQAVFSPAVTRDVSNRDWSLGSIFERSIKASCPVAEESTITLLKPDDHGFIPKYLVEPLPHRQEDMPLLEDDESELDLETTDQEEQLKWQQTQTDRWRKALDRKGKFVYDVKDLSPYGGELDFSVKWPEEQRYRYPDRISPPSLQASRTLTGHGQERSVLTLTLRNNHMSQSRSVLYFDTLPWFVKPYLHTLRTSVQADEFDEQADGLVRFVDEVTDPVVQELSYQPSVPRKSPFHLEVRLRVPPASTVTLSIDVDRAFLRYAEHPPDAHRGFDIPPAIIFPQGASPIYTLPNLVELATPDFSFVYTNIIFTSTVIALFFGSTLNSMVRKFVDIVL